MHWRFVSTGEKACLGRQATMMCRIRRENAKRRGFLGNGRFSPKRAVVSEMLLPICYGLVSPRWTENKMQ